MEFTAQQKIAMRVTVLHAILMQHLAVTALDTADPKAWMEQARGDVLERLGALEMDAASEKRREVLEELNAITIRAFQPIIDLL